MPSESDLKKFVDDTLSIEWGSRTGNTVPDTETVTLKNGAVEVEAVFLYADLAATSRLADLCPWKTTAKIIRTYLDCSVRIIRSYGGQVRSFDGDRVMGVFMGDYKNTNAISAGREIFYTVEKIIGPKATNKFQSIRNNKIKLKNCVGIDWGTARAVRAGIRGSNDLIWVGKAPSFAAKLSDVRNYAHCVYISSRSYNQMDSKKKFDNGKNIWTKRSFQFAGKVENVYSTNYMMTP